MLPSLGGPDGLLLLPVPARLLLMNDHKIITIIVKNFVARRTGGGGAKPTSGGAISPLQLEPPLLDAHMVADGDCQVIRCQSSETTESFPDG